MQKFKKRAGDERHGLAWFDVTDQNGQYGTPTRVKVERCMPGDTLGWFDNGEKQR